MPKATIEKAITNFKTQDLLTEFIVEVRAPGRVAIILECLGKQRKDFPSKLNPILKRYSATMEYGVIKMFIKNT